MRIAKHQKYSCTRLSKTQQASHQPLPENDLLHPATSKQLFDITQGTNCQLASPVTSCNSTSLFPWLRKVVVPVRSKSSKRWEFDSATQVSSTHKWRPSAVAPLVTRIGASEVASGGGRGESWHAIRRDHVTSRSTMLLTSFPPPRPRQLHQCPCQAL